MTGLSWPQEQHLFLCFCIIWKFFVQLELLVFPHRRPRPANTAVAKQLFQSCSVVGFGWVFFWKLALWGFHMTNGNSLSHVHLLCNLKQGFHLLALRSESMTAIVPLHFSRNNHTQSFWVFSYCWCFCTIDTSSQVLKEIPPRHLSKSELPFFLVHVTYFSCKHFYTVSESSATFSN